MILEAFFCSKKTLLYDIISLLLTTYVAIATLERKPNPIELYRRASSRFPIKKQHSPRDSHEQPQL